MCQDYVGLRVDNTCGLCLCIEQKRVTDAEEERQSIVIEEEDQVKDYRNLLQQLHSLRADIRSIAFAPRYSLPYLQPGYLTSFSSSRLK